MIYFKNGGCLVECVDDLPNPNGFEEMFLDFETSSGDPKLDSLNPWMTDHCTVIGAAVTFDNVPTVWFIPRRFLAGWLKKIWVRAGKWINHNLKYDHHVGTNDLDLPNFEGSLYCTLAASKVFDSDMTFKGGYGLTNLSKKWLHEDIAGFEKRFTPYIKHPNGQTKSKDYGDVPLDIMAEYGCQDVITNRKLYHFLEKQTPEECQRVKLQELELTKVLLDVEQAGLRIEPNECKAERLKTLVRMLQIEERLHSLVGYMFNPTTNKDCHDVLCNHYGLPVIAWTNADDPDAKHNPSFTADALQVYSEWKGEHVEVTNLMLEHRKLTNYRGLFLEPYLNLHRDGVLHSDYNQSVRSGRMSCKKPNGQQLDKKAKALVKPPEGKVFFSSDLSQVEYRLIAHYVNDTRAIEAYANDPYIDYHQWVADLIQIPRTPAKTINFMIGFGGGKATTRAKLAQLAEIRERCGSPEAIDAESLRLYNAYHANLPGLKRSARQAEGVARRQGYVKNLFGRHLRLPTTRAHVAFNRAVQSTAADLAKYISVELHKRGLTLHAIVHDEFLLSCDKNEVEDVAREVFDVINHPPIPVRVPIRGSAEWSEKSWADCGSNALNPKNFEGALVPGV